MIWMDVDAALSEVPVNIAPLIDDTDFKSIEASVAYNAGGMALKWNFVTTAGAYTQTAVTPTTGGDYDWASQGNGMYSIEMTATGGASANNDTEGFGWFSGVATGVLPWRGPLIGFRAAALNNSMVDGTTIDVNVKTMTNIDFTAAMKTSLGTAVGTAQTGDSFARLGAPDGASVSADIAAAALNIATAENVLSDPDFGLVKVKEDTAAILIDTGTTLDTLIQNIPTNTEFNARTLASADYATATALDTVDNLLDTEIGAIKTVVDAVKLKTDNLPTDPADQSAVETAINALPTASEILTALQTSLVDDTITYNQLQKLILAILAGKAVVGTGTVAYKREDGATTAITVAHDEVGNRTIITIGDLT